MNISKRGDHLFAAGLWKTIADVAHSARLRIGEYSEGRLFADVLFELAREFGGDGAFDITINRGRAVTGADAHSSLFGRAIERFKQDMEALIFAVQYRRGIDERDQKTRADVLTQANSGLLTAKQSATITVGRVFDAVVDRDVLRQILDGVPNAGARDDMRRKIEMARTTLAVMRHRLLDSIARM
ncbi:hypothetical protein [Burkholderia dolosa]|uniref:hypothetical protein n=1 Tax=Burkholderia dolosa TaxID=152500 RepID=UPI001B97328B|nr:hypothetical protein [Burkholderia dolosa]MBR8058602.1 hypothetical protein [Burkholderia dolosa]MBR8302050.1 hypothetical protein [Burkholderia dolosa]MBR8314630.1 hypothetical protein [Burkholderia dolosa]